jgi:hypothetical protein
MSGLCLDNKAVRNGYLSASTRVLDFIKIQEKYSPPMTEKFALSKGLSEKAVPCKFSARTNRPTNTFLKKEKNSNDNR